ncbi:MAG: ribonuclease HI family protein [Synergistetes bacterium]|nr:ribonuclease HI family protein [Synergistota bacterium]
MVVEVFTDGASKGNPGDASIGIVLRYTAEGRDCIERIGMVIGKTTNNIAEYAALIVALRRVIKLDADEVNLFMDSELVYRQLIGRYKVKSEKLQPFYEEAKRLMKRIPRVTLNHVMRNQNREADAFANEVMRLYKGYVR